MRRQSDKFSLEALPFFILAALVLINYGGTLKAEFVYDDHTQLVENVVLRSLRNIPLFFTDPAHTSGSMIFEEIYRPVRATVFAVGYTLWGLNPLGFHAVNILLHALNACLVFLFLKRLVRAPFPALAGALLFAAHPALTENVCWVCSISDILCMFFYLTAFLSYFRYREAVGSRRITFFVSALVTMVLAQFSKEMGVTFPAALVVTDIWREGFKRQSPKRWLEYAPFVVVTMGYLVFRATIMSQFAQRAPWGANALDTAGIMARGIAYYIRLLVFPFKLTVVPYIDISLPLLSVESILAVTLVLALLAAAVIFRRRHPVASLGIILFFILLLPVSNIVPIKAVVGDRFIYIPSLGLFVVAAALFNVLESAQISRSLQRKALIAGALALVVFLFSVKTVIRSIDWKDGFSLFNSAVKVAPDDPRARAMLGKEYFFLGDYNAAREQCLLSLKRNPAGSNARILLASIYLKDGLLNQAEQEFKTALQFDPTSGDIHNSLGLIYRAQGKLDEALAEFQLALKNNPVVSEILNNVGSVYLRKGDAAPALGYFVKALEAKPDNWEAMCNLAYALIKLQRYPEAISFIENSLARYPGDAELLTLLGEAYSESKNYEAAVKAYERAIAASASDTRASGLLAALYVDLGQYENAVSIYKKILAKYPAAAGPRVSLAETLEKAGQLNAAIEELQIAARLNPNEATVHRKLAEILRKAGKRVDAERERERAEELAKSPSD